MEGFFIKCTITLWLTISGQSLPIPSEGTGKCKVIVEEIYSIDNGSSGYYYIDCTSSFSWVETTTPMKQWVPKESCELE